MRIRYVERFGAAPLDPEIAASVARAVDVLRRLGHQVEEGPLPFDVSDLEAAWPLFGQTAVAYLLTFHGKEGVEVPDKYRQMAAAGDRIPAARYFDAIERVDGLRRRVTVAFEQTDVIMTPSAAALPWPAEEGYPPEIDGSAVGPRGHAVYTAWVNACGHPGINLPADPSAAGLPIGFQLVGRFGDDELLLRLAAQYQAAAPWAERWPALARGS